jgi:dephospho-CoA kinase
MLKVAVTGNIGSGKSTVTQVFQSLGIPVFHADAEAKRLYSDPEVQKQVRAFFGEGIYDKNGKLKKQELAEIIFNDPAALKKINSIIHPLTLEKYKLWLGKHNDYTYTIHESAILFENNLQSHFDKIINVSAPAQLRIKRVMERDSSSFDTISERIKNQMPDEKKNQLADFVIINDEQQFIIPQVMKINSIFSKK